MWKNLSGELPLVDKFVLATIKKAPHVFGGGRGMAVVRFVGKSLNRKLKRFGKLEILRA